MKNMNWGDLYDLRNELISKAVRLNESSSLYFFDRDNCTLFFSDSTGRQVNVANFIFVITKTINIHDSTGIVRQEYLVVGLQGDTVLKEVQLSAESLLNSKWIFSYWGIGIRFNTKLRSERAYQILLDAAKLMFNENDVEDQYCDIGWVKTSVGYCYVTGDEIISPVQNDVTSSPELKGFELNAKKNIDPREAFNYTLKMLGVAKFSVTALLFCILFSSLLYEFYLSAGLSPQVIVFICGKTGSGKTVLTKEIFRIWKNNVTGSFLDTKASLEFLINQFKDSMIVIDDFNNANDRELSEKLEYVIRLLGDTIDKKRMNGQMKKQKAFIPRCMAVITGEDMPKKFSSAARTFIVPIKNDDVRWELATTFQNSGSLLGSCVRDYLFYISRNTEFIKNEISSSFYKYRKLLSEACTNAAHKRLIQSAAILLTGIHFFFDYAIKSSFLSKEKAFKKMDSIVSVMTKLIKFQSGMLSEEDPMNLFFTGLNSLIATKKIEIQTKGVEPITKTYVGAQDTDYFYLLPDELYRHITNFYRSQGKVFPLTLRMLIKNLDDADLIETERENKQKQRTIKKQLYENVYTRVLVIKKIKLDGYFKFIERGEKYVSKPFFRKVTDVD